MCVCVGGILGCRFQICSTSAMLLWHYRPVFEECVKDVVASLSQRMKVDLKGKGGPLPARCT